MNTLCSGAEAPRGLKPTLHLRCDDSLAADGQGCTRIENKRLICVHLCESVVQITFFSVLLVSARESLEESFDRREA